MPSLLPPRPNEQVISEASPLRSDGAAISYLLWGAAKMRFHLSKELREVRGVRCAVLGLAIWWGLASVWTIHQAGS